jgi:hypothetical protein
MIAAGTVLGHEFFPLYFLRVCVRVLTLLWFGCVQRYPFVVVYNDAKWNLEKRFSDFAELDGQLDEEFKNDEDVTVCSPRL